MVTRTTGPLHFGDLDPLRFEDLCLSIVYRMRRWLSLDHLGRLGSDEGVDIRACEQLENGKKNVHHFQCKRYAKITKTDLKKIVKEYSEKNLDKADYYYLVTGCNVSKSNIDYFNKLCDDNGFKHVALWTSSVLEAMLYSNYHDLLFAFFGVNMTTKRNDRIDSIRRNIDLKHKMHADFYKSSEELRRDPKDLMGRPWRKYKYPKVLIRSIYDTKYPDNPRLDGNYIEGYFKAEVYDFYHNGLQVFGIPNGINAKVKIKELHGIVEREVIREMQLYIVECIPFENIIAYDLDGDEYYRCPHLYCDFPNGSDPFAETCYYTEIHQKIDETQIIEILDS